MTSVTPIREIATEFDLPLSTLHYWERRGLIEPTRRSGQRWFDRAQRHRVALIRMWQATGLMSLDDIEAVLAGGAGEVDWRVTVTERLADIERQVERLRIAATYLDHLLACPRDNPATDCPELRRQVGG